MLARFSHHAQVCGVEFREFPDLIPIKYCNCVVDPTDKAFAAQILYHAVHVYSRQSQHIRHLRLRQREMETCA